MQQGSARVNETAIGIDVGTTAVKAALVADDGRLLVTHSGTYPITRKAGGIAEQNPKDCVGIIAEALKHFAAQGYTNGIRAVGLCSQVNIHVFVDEKGDPVMPAMPTHVPRYPYCGSTPAVVELPVVVAVDQQFYRPV